MSTAREQITEMREEVNRIKNARTFQDMELEEGFIEDSGGRFELLLGWIADEEVYLGRLVDLLRPCCNGDLSNILLDDLLEEAKNLREEARTEVAEMFSTSFDADPATYMKELFEKMEVLSYCFKNLRRIRKHLLRIYDLVCQVDDETKS